jgi:hypothetical protein
VSSILKPVWGLTSWLLGEDSHVMPPLPQGLPRNFAEVLESHVRMLIEYQNTEYAMLYLDRLGRFHGRHGISEALFEEIAGLLARRMAVNDPVHVARIVLGKTQLADAGQLELTNNLYRPEVEEIVAMLPRNFAETIVDGLTSVKMLRGRLRLHVDGAWGRARLYFFLLFRRNRPQSLRYARESSSIERWLHMIDRALSRQPSAVTEIVRSISIVHGQGGGRRLALANWDLIVTRLAKPVFDGELALPQLDEALVQARNAAMADPSGAELLRTVTEIRATAAGEASRREAGA